eukprot:g54703.t1
MGDMFGDFTPGGGFGPPGGGLGGGGGDLFGAPSRASSLTGAGGADDLFNLGGGGGGGAVGAGSLNLGGLGGGGDLFNLGGGGSSAAGGGDLFGGGGVGGGLGGLGGGTGGLGGDIFGGVGGGGSSGGLGGGLDAFGGSSSSSSSSGLDMFGSAAGGGGGDLFGTSSNSSSSNTGLDLFGSSTSSGGGLGGGDLFGSSTGGAGGDFFGTGGGSGLGGGGPDLFGTSSSGGLGGGGADLFGSSTGGTGGGLFGGSAATSNAWASAGSFGPTDKSAGQREQDAISQRFQALVKAYRPDVPECKFQFFFYNMVDPDKVGLAAPPPNCDMRLWNSAKQNNPNPDKLVPSRAVGFGDLAKRAVAAQKAQDIYTKMLSNLQTQITSMSQKHKAMTKPSIEALRRNQVNLSTGLLKVISRLECRRACGLQLDTQEIDYRKKLDTLNRELAKPRFARFIAELESRNRLQDVRSEPSSPWHGLGDAADSVVFEFLNEQRKGLELLTGILQADLHDMTVVVNRSRQAARQGWGDDMYLPGQAMSRGNGPGVGRSSNMPTSSYSPWL